MKKIIFIVSLALSYNLFAQQSTLDITLESVTENNINWEMVLSLTGSNTIESGIAIILPQGLQAIPMNVQIDDKNVWLQNSDQAPQLDSVVTWQDTEQSLIILFSSGLVLGGESVQITCMTSLLRSPISTEEVIEIKPVQSASVPIQISDQIFASANIPVTLSK
jgi:hypothetical protein